MKISIFWSSLASYTHDCFSVLNRSGVRLQLFYRADGALTSYAAFDMSVFEEVRRIQACDDVFAAAAAWQPDLCLMVSWNYPNYRQACVKLRKRGVYVVSATDNQWLGTFRQHLGVLSSPFLLKPAIDAFLVPGDRQEQFMRKLGFSRVVQGWYGVDALKFRSTTPVTSRRRAFLFLGRMVDVKGFAELIAGYTAYRHCSKAPWELHAAGKGPLEQLCDQVEGVVRLGFVQPADLPARLNEYRVLLLPSHFEPWGVVVHEAALCGLAIVTSPACGAADKFVRAGENGEIVAVTPEAICQALLKLESLSEQEWTGLSQRSEQLGKAWTLNDLVGLFLKEFCPPRTPPQSIGDPSG